MVGLRAIPLFRSPSVFRKIKNRKVNIPDRFLLWKPRPIRLKGEYDMETGLSQRVLQDQTQQTVNPLIGGISRVLGRVASLKELARAYYFEVVLSLYRCPDCSGRLKMVGVSECSCPCGKTLDPTIAFQQSPCCSAGLVRKTFHYACSKCHGIIPSRFLFDERLFDKAYFREMMQEARARERKKKEELKAILMGSRSDNLILLEEPCLDSIPGLTEALNGFIGQKATGFEDFLSKTGFSMGDYRSHLLTIIGKGSMLFSDIAPLIKDFRRDRIWRFVTLIFMRQDHEVSLTQYGPDILVERLT
jgi:hypothetical protein